MTRTARLACPPPLPRGLTAARSARPPLQLVHAWIPIHVITTITAAITTTIAITSAVAITNATDATSAANFDPRRSQHE